MPWPRMLTNFRQNVEYLQAQDTNLTHDQVDSREKDNWSNGTPSGAGTDLSVGAAKEYAINHR